MQSRAGVEEYDDITTSNDDYKLRLALIHSVHKTPRAHTTNPVFFLRLRVIPSHSPAKPFSKLSSKSKDFLSELADTGKLMF